MPMTMEAIAQDVEARTLKDGRVIYDVVIQDGSKWTAWEKDLAEEAWKLRGTMALMEVDVKQNGQFTNRTLKKIAAKVDSGFAPALNAMEQSIGRHFTEPYVAPEEQSSFDKATAPQQAPQFSQAQQEGTGTPKDISIWRQVAAKVAAVLSDTREEYWENVAENYRFFETGIIPGRLAREIEQETRAADPMASVTFEEATGTAPDDDIPF